MFTKAVLPSFGLVGLFLTVVTAYNLESLNFFVCICMRIETSHIMVPVRFLLITNTLASQRMITSF